MKIRKFRDIDKQACMDIWKSSFQDDPDFCYMYFSEIISVTDSYVCELDLRVVGYLAVIRFNADTPDGQIVCNYIYGVCVHPEFRGKGIMRMMMETVMSSYDGVFLLIPEINGVYEKLGFKYLCEKQTVAVREIRYQGSECYDIALLDDIYNIYRKKFDFSLKRTRKWWNIIINAAVSDGYRIISNKGAYAIIRDNKIIEFAYISDYFRDSLIIGDAVLTLPPVMYFGEYKYNDCYVAMMLDWE